MIWEDTHPEDTLPANTIHTILQNIKLQLRERFELNDGSVKEHYASDSTSAGLHEPSIVGFCGYLTDWATRPTTGLVENSFWFIDSGDSYEGLYTIHDGDYILVAPTSHSEDSIVHPKLSNTYLDSQGYVIDCHSQYIDRTEEIRLTKDATFETLNVTNVDGGTTGTVPKTHEDDDWETAHGTGVVTSRLIDGSIDSSLLDIDVLTGTDYVYSPVGVTGLMSMPLSRNCSYSFPFYPDNSGISSECGYDEYNDRYFWNVGGGTEAKCYFIRGVEQS